VPEGLPQDWNQWRGQVNLADYDERWRRMEAAGANPHGEADLVCTYRPRTVLDGGCGTGRVAVELARRGVDVVGTDVDQDMIARARDKAGELRWVLADLSELDLPNRFDVIVLAGNVIPYVEDGRRSAAVRVCARHLASDGRMVAGFQLQPGWPSLADYDRWCDEAGLELEDRWSTWDRKPWNANGSYAVSVHRLRRSAGRNS
jgi:SAM-dependent methyltransferase